MHLLARLRCRETPHQDEPHQKGDDQDSDAQGGGDGPLGQAVAEDIAFQKFH